MTHPIFELVELKVLRAQPCNKHHYADVTWLNKNLKRHKNFFFPVDQEMMQINSAVTAGNKQTIHNHTYTF